MQRVTEDADVHYVAAGGVVVHDGRVLVLRRSGRSEVRLPKGHVEPGESAPAAALRETREESGYDDLVLGAGLGTQAVEFDSGRRHVVRTEHYFLMTLAGDPAWCSSWAASARRRTPLQRCGRRWSVH